MTDRVRGRIAPALLAALLVAACGGAQPSTAPVVDATTGPVATPDPHLAEPATADDVLRKLALAGLRITPNNASVGPSGEPIKSINASFEGWPLQISQYSSGVALRKVEKFDPAKGPRGGDSTYMLVGLNILVEYGPAIHTKKDPPPDARFRSSALKLVEVLDPLLGPLEQVSIDPLPLPGAPATTAPSPSAAASPEASPKP